MDEKQTERKTQDVKTQPNATTQWGTGDRDMRDVHTQKEPLPNKGKK